MQEAASPDTVTSSDLSIDDIYRLIGTDFDKVNQLIKKRLHSEVALINQLSNYIIYSGGKRLRPVLVLLSARALNYEGNQHINLAAIGKCDSGDDRTFAEGGRRGAECYCFGAIQR